MLEGDKGLRRMVKRCCKCNRIINISYTGKHEPYLYSKGRYYCKDCL